MTVAGEFIGPEFWQKLLAWVGFLILILRPSLTTVKYHRPPPKLTIQRHVDLACKKTGYVAAFMARNGILITLSVFVMSGLPKIGPKDFEGVISYGAIALTFCFFLYHAGLVLIVTGKIIERWNFGDD